jgi:hypothetical protein
VNCPQKANIALTKISRDQFYLKRHYAIGGGTGAYLRRSAMKIVDDHIEVTEEEASGGVKEHGVRYVLAASLLLAIIVMSAMWIIPAVTN